MYEENYGPVDWRADIEFLRANVTATNILIQGLIDQNAIDREALGAYFSQCMEKMPSDRSTLAARLVLDQWLHGMRGTQESAPETTAKSFEVIVGGRHSE